MGIGPQIVCDRCGRQFFGGKGYDSGEENFCYECLVPMVNTITEGQFEKLGVTQRGFFNLVKEMGGLDGLGGQEKTIEMLKINAGEIEKSEIEENKEEGMIFISDEELENLRPKDKFKWVQWEIKDYTTSDWDRQPFIFQCLRCNSHFTYKKCINCGHTEFEATGSHGVFCIKCGEGFTSWPCKDCGTKNPTKNTYYILRNQGCFIATAIYGGENAYEVELLRDFRDRKLIILPYGRLFVKFYYLLSPFIALLITKTKVLRPFLKLSFFNPFINLIRRKLWLR